MPVSNETLSRSRRESQVVEDITSETAERLMMTEKLINELNETWEEKIRKSEEIRRQRSEFYTFFLLTWNIAHKHWLHPALTYATTGCTGELTLLLLILNETYYSGVKSKDC